MMTIALSLNAAPGPPIGLLLRKLDGLIDERFERALGARGITRRQWQLLNRLGEQPATIDVLTAAVAPFLDRAAGETAGRHLEPLVERGVVVRRGDAYEISASGRSLFERLNEHVMAVRELVVRGLPAGEYDRTIASLQTMVRNLEDDR